MEAKDTVMQDSELFSKMRDKYLGLDAEIDVDWDLIKITKKAQAEITWDVAFKAGEKQATQKYREMIVRLIVPSTKRKGINEVVEFIEKEFGYFTDEGLAKIIVDDSGYYGQEGSMAKWQAQKKVWGINNES